jgi:DNA-binding response OmpR family regulator
MNVLVVEDEARLAENIATALRGDSFNVTVAHNGLEAERALALGTFDVVVMDITMPEQDGLTTLGRIRAAGNTVPVMLLTALGEVEDRVDGLNAGADDYLTKPFAFSELTARIHALLRRPVRSVSDILEYDTVELDRNQKVARRAGKEVTLSHTEYRLLEFLMRHPETVQNETELLEHVWDQNYNGLSNVVAVYIGYVRTKIDKAFPDERPLIHTVRGLGYTLNRNV